MSTDTLPELELCMADWSTDRDALRALREQVFIVEQQVPRDIEWDGCDEDALHILGTLDGVPSACGRLLPGGKIGRMAVLAAQRGRGHGAAVLQALVDAAREQGLTEVYLHAQQHAADFYRRAGFEPEGEPFVEAGIPHIAMRQQLQPPVGKVYTSGIEYPHPFAEWATALTADASREICILSPDLDHRAFDHRDLVDALSALARRSRQSRVRILVSGYRPMVQRGHRLLALARRLPSSILLQQLDEHPDWKGETLVLKDRSGVLCKPAEADKAAFCEPDSRARTERYLELFEELWRHSAQHIEFRSVPL
ncbi:GNAT family N-acetyltransferase [Haliea sp. E1-2-M8]|uniref:GNAT family N-acetyltransferase n=1 Tax=Haliea sp. E1-2-M8 TaxID=3064706 RepID=UPI002726BDB1|nr:GNAT family N-acetyltransferase [Haliea sp. E1-2-M8]MDO8861868.1 GNAT family N-acetyltransferase [Haliea sp. E1-2-M8]